MVTTTDVPRLNGHAHAPVPLLPPLKIGPLEAIEQDVLVGIVDSCPIDGLSEAMFSSFARKTVFRILAEYVREMNASPGAELLAHLLSAENVHPLHRAEVDGLTATIREELRCPLESRGRRHFDVYTRELRQAYRQSAALRFLDDARRRISSGENLSEIGLMRLADSWQDETDQHNGPQHFGKLLTDFTSLHEPIIDGLGRRGETANIVSGTKIGKTWLLHGMALSVATGNEWMGHRIGRPRNVLLIDNELHPSTLVWRIRSVADAMGLQREDYQDRLRVLSVRGKGVDVTHLRRIARQCGTWQPDFVGIDSWYRFMPAGSNENDNAGMKDVAEQIIRFADDLNAMVAVVHHSTKGDQSERGVTDVGSGAGSIARAADTHLILRPHKEDGCAVMEARVRSFEQPEARVIRWNFPLWTLDDDLDPCELRSPKQAAQDAKDASAMDEVEKAATEIVLDGRLATNNALRNSLGWGKARVDKIVNRCLKDGRLFSTQDGEQMHFTPHLEVPNEF